MYLNNCVNENVLRLKNKELFVLKAIGSLILKREGEENNNKKIEINAHSVHKETEILGNRVAYNTCMKYLKQLKDL